jgi:hypothetical protein
VSKLNTKDKGESHKDRKDEPRQHSNDLKDQDCERELVREGVPAFGRRASDGSKGKDHEEVGC